MLCYQIDGAIYKLKVFLLMLLKNLKHTFSTAYLFSVNSEKHCFKSCVPKSLIWTKNLERNGITVYNNALQKNIYEYFDI